MLSTLDNLTFRRQLAPRKSKAAMGGVPSSTRALVVRFIPIALPFIVLYSVIALDAPSNSARKHLSDASSNPPFHNLKQQIPRPPASEPRAAPLQTATVRTPLDQPQRRLALSVPPPKPIPPMPLRYQRLPSCAESPHRAKSFLFVFMGHSGSSAILSELREHPQVHLEGTEPVDHHQYQFNSSLALQFTRSFFNRAISYGKTPGFKIRPWHIKHSPKEWAALVREFDTRIVWQYRNNLVKQAVGEYSYKFLNDSSVLEGLKSKDQVRTRCQKGAGCSFRIDDFDFFHKMLKTSFHSDLAIAESVHKIIDGGTCVHPFPYEHYLYDRETSMRRLQQFLGLRYVENEPQRFKATGDNLCKVVENWKELCENFYSCHVWRHMFDDVHNACVCDFSSGHSKYCDTSYD